MSEKFNSRQFRKKLEKNHIVVVDGENKVKRDETENYFLDFIETGIFRPKNIIKRECPLWFFVGNEMVLQLLLGVFSILQNTYVPRSLSLSLPTYVYTIHKHYIYQINHIEKSTNVPTVLQRFWSCLLVAYRTAPQLYTEMKI